MLVLNVTVGTGGVKASPGVLLPRGKPSQQATVFSGDSVDFVMFFCYLKP